MKVEDIVNGVRAFFDLVLSEILLIAFTVFLISIVSPLGYQGYFQKTLVWLQTVERDEALSSTLKFYGLNEMFPFFVVFVLVSLIFVHRRTRHFLTSFVPFGFSYSAIDVLTRGDRDTARFVVSILDTLSRADGNRMVENIYDTKVLNESLAAVVNSEAEFFSAVRERMIAQL